ncbi:MAG TPA: hypothetical protein PL193_07565 [Xanthobacteraceae bacterium]|nr:hypothetical protein [Xanthobacteraceae bacterium]
MTISHLGNISGSANAVVAEATPPLLSSYVHGQTFRLVPAANNTNAVTINIDGRGARALRNSDDGALTGGELASGKGIEFWYDAAVDRFKLSAQTVAQAIASLAASVAASNLWDTIIEIPTAPNVTQIEQTFTAGLYELIEVVFDGLSLAGSGRPIFSLRNNTTAIVTLDDATNNIAGNADVVTGSVRFVVGNLGPKVSLGILDYALAAANGAASMFTAKAGAAHSTAADRIRIQSSTVNAFDAGRITIRGRRRTA